MPVEVTMPQLSDTMTEGTVVKWYGTNTDIDDRRRAEEELRRSEAALAEGQRLSLTGSFSWRVAPEAITFSEAPHMLGLPSLHTGHWDPLMAACEETGTVVCLHTGASAWAPLAASQRRTRPSTWPVATRFFAESAA